MRGRWSDESDRWAVVAVAAAAMATVMASAFVGGRGSSPPVPDAALVVARVAAFWTRVEAARMELAEHHWSHRARRTTTTHGRLTLERGRSVVEYRGGRRVIGEAGIAREEGPPGSSDPEVLVAGLAVLSAPDALGRFDVEARRPSRHDPGSADHVMLRPRDASPFSALYLHVSNAPGTEGVVLRLVLRAGDDFTRLDFSGFDFTPPFDDAPLR